MWSRISKNIPPVSIWKNCLNIARWPELLTGRNSVTPWTIPIMIVFIISHIVKYPPIYLYSLVFSVITFQHKALFKPIIMIYVQPAYAVSRYKFTPIRILKLLALCYIVTYLYKNCNAQRQKIWLYPISICNSMSRNQNINIISDDIHIIH